MELGDYGIGAASLTLTPMDGLAPDEIDRVRVIVKLRTDPAHRRKGHATLRRSSSRARIRCTLQRRKAWAKCR
jgi:hypothetical protein